MPKIAFGLGGNVGDTRTHLITAIRYLCALPYADSNSLCTSSLYESPALLDDNAPQDWDMPFINQVITLECNTQDWEQLLYDIKQIETKIGRVTRGHWAPREIDIDIIAVEGVEYQSNSLTIPHKEAWKRNFVMLPLKEVWAECQIKRGN